jgi:uncharacterized protein (TIGR02391 family)
VLETVLTTYPPQGNYLMPKRPSPEPTPIVTKVFTAQEIDRGIDKLQRRIHELKTLDPSVLPHDDASVENLTHRIRESIREVFGENSPEFKKYRHIEIGHGDIPSFGFMDDERIVEAHTQQRFADGIPHTIKILEGLIDWLKEKQEDFRPIADTKPKADIDGLNLHARIGDVCVELYKDQHYADAVFNASKALVNYVKEKSGRFDLDGAPLMRTVFSKNDPVLAFNALQDQSDFDEQEGMMHLFEGAVLALRNPRGHSFRYDTPEKALEYIGFLSLLAKSVAEAKRKK